MNKKFHSGGFVFVEFAIALPLLIFLMFGLATVGTKIFHASRMQMANYILESEAQYLMERVTQEARVAKKIEDIPYYTDEIDGIEFIYHTGGAPPKKENSPFSVADIWETRFFLPHPRKADEYDDSSFYYANINAKHQREIEGNPITGSTSEDRPNFAPFGDTKITRFKFDRHGNILHVSLEMQSMDTGKKIRLNTAVFMPACEKQEEQEEP